MIWLSILSLVVGAVLAQRFKIVVLVPAMFAVAVVAIGVGIAQAKTVWTDIMMICAASAAMQVGYFAGVLIRHALGAILACRSSSLSDTPRPHGIPRISGPR